MQKRYTRQAFAVVCAALALGLGLGTAQAGTDAGGRMGMHPLLRHFDDIDTDASGTLSPEELAARAQQRFAAADTNDDGQLDQGELEAMIRARLAARQARNPEAAPAPSTDEARIAWMAQGVFLYRDTDGDGRLSAEEMRPRPARMTRMLARLDSNGDGALSRDELMAARPPRGAGSVPGQP